MMGFFGIRKLLHSRKLTKDFAIQQLEVKFYKLIGPHVHFLNRRNLDEIYGFESGRSRTVTVEYLCNQVIHSYVFALNFDEPHKLHSILVSSEFTRNEELFEIPITTIADLFERAGKGEAHFGFSFEYDESVGDYVVRRLRKDDLIPRPD